MYAVACLLFCSVDKEAADQSNPFSMQLPAIKINAIELYETRRAVAITQN